MDASSPKDSLGKKLTTDENFAYNTLVYVFRYLDFLDLVVCSLVCPIWSRIVNDDRSPWNYVRVYGCPPHVTRAVEVYYPKIKHLDIINASVMTNDELISLLSKLEQLQSIRLHKAHGEQLSILAIKFKKISRVYVEVDWGPVNLDVISNLEDLTSLDLLTNDNIADVKPLLKLKKLKHLSLRAYCEKQVWETIAKINTLESLCLETNIVSTWLHVFFESRFLLKNLTNLRKLEIRDMPYFHEHDMLNMVACLRNIKELILVNISISKRRISNFGALLGQCVNIERLTLTLHRVMLCDEVLDVALDNSEVLKGVIALRNNLKYFCWHLDMYGIFKVEKFYNIDNVTAVKFPNYEESGTRISIEDVIPVNALQLEEILRNKLPTTQVLVLQPQREMKERTCFTCSKKVSTRERRFKRELEWLQEQKETLDI